MNTRQQDIILLTQQRGEITIKELSQLLQVSEMTIHRDLDYLQEQRYLYKKRGAAMYLGESPTEKQGFYAEEKRRIGKMAASFIHPGQSVLFDNSTTALECARFLGEIENVTFYTTNLEIAALLSSNTKSILYCSGGFYSQDSTGFVGRHTEDFVSSIHADLCIIGASGISLDHGVTIPYPMHAELQRKIIRASTTRILLADHSKFDKAAVEKVADLSQIHTIITDSGIFPGILESYSNHINIVTA